MIFSLAFPAKTSHFTKKYNKTIKDGDISPWPLDHNCPYGHMERFDQMEWREHNNGLDQSYGEDRQACVSCAFAPSARRPCVWKRLDGILCTISYISISSLKLQVPGCTWLYFAVPGCIWLYLAELGCTRLYMAELDCTWLYLALFGCTWLYQTVLGYTW